MFRGLILSARTITWHQWQGHTSVLAAMGVTRTPEDDGSVYVLGGGVELDPDDELTCDWRDGDVW